MKLPLYMLFRNICRRIDCCLGINNHHLITFLSSFSSLPFSTYQSHICYIYSQSPWPLPLQAHYHNHHNLHPPCILNILHLNNFQFFPTKYKVKLFLNRKCTTLSCEIRDTDWGLKVPKARSPRNLFSNCFPHLPLGINQLAAGLFILGIDQLFVGWWSYQNKTGSWTVTKLLRSHVLIWTI